LLIGIIKRKMQKTPKNSLLWIREGGKKPLAGGVSEAGKAGMGNGTPFIP
jgi:hypothetical protein